MAVWTLLFAQRFWSVWPLLFAKRFWTLWTLLSAKRFWSAWALLFAKRFWDAVVCKALGRCFWRMHLAPAGSRVPDIYFFVSTLSFAHAIESVHTTIVKNRLCVLKS